MQLESLAKAAESLCFKIPVTLVKTLARALAGCRDALSSGRSAPAWCSHLLSSLLRTTQREEGMPLKLRRSDSSRAEPPALKVSVAARRLHSCGGWRLKRVFSCT